MRHTSPDDEDELNKPRKITTAVKVFMPYAPTGYNPRVSTRSRRGSSNQKLPPSAQYARTNRNNTLKVALKNRNFNKNAADGFHANFQANSR